MRRFTPAARLALCRYHIFAVLLLLSSPSGAQSKATSKNTGATKNNGAGSADKKRRKEAAPPKNTGGTKGASTQKGDSSAAAAGKGAKPKIEYPKLTKFVPAPYPPSMRKAGKEGIVKLALSLDDKGNVAAVAILVSAGKEFDDAARAAALQWKFVPAKLDGKPIPSKIPISYPFRLKGKASGGKGSPKAPACDAAKDPGCSKGGAVKVTKTSCNPAKDPSCRKSAPKRPAHKGACDAASDPACKDHVTTSGCDPASNPACKKNLSSKACDPEADPLCKKPAHISPCDPKKDPLCKKRGLESQGGANPICDPARDPTCKRGDSAAVKKAGMAVLSGIIQEKGGATKIEDAEVAVYVKVGKKGFGRKIGTAFSDKKGRFSLSVYPGAYIIKVLAPGCFAFEAEETLALAERLTVRYYVRRKEEDPYTTTIVGKKDRKEVTRYSVTLPEIIAIPGTQGDALKAIQNMPGVARAPFGIGLIVVRGAAPGDTKIYFEGHFIPQLYHFVGLTSVFNSDLLKKIDFIPGNFSPRYGNALGGVIDVTTRKPKSDTYHGYLDMDIWDAGVLLEGPMPGIFNKGSFALSLRRSWIDSVIRPLQSTLNVGVAPVYYDYQAIAHHPLFGGDLKFLFFGSDDRLLILDNDLEPYKTNFQKLLGLWSKKWGDNALKLSLSFGISTTIFETPQNDFNVNYDFHRTVWRVDYTRKFTKNFKLAMGLDGTYLDAAITVRRSVVQGEDDYNDDFRDPFGSWSVTFDSNILRQAAWLEGDWTLFDRLSLFPGLRFDFWNDEQGNHYSLDPRFTTKFDIIKKKLAIKAGVGLYTQTPSFFYYQEDIGNPNLKHENSIHYSVGARWQALRSMSLSLTGFYKHLYGLVASTDASYVTPENVEKRLNFDNTGYGRIYGMEFLLKKDNSLQCPPLLGFKKCFGWLSYTLLRSERKDTKDGEWYLFDFDQTHILTAIYSGKWGNGWTFGLRFRLTSGNPTTPYMGGIYNADTGRYVGVQGTYNSDRLPLFHQLDVRVDKKFTFNRWSLTLYLDVQNVYYNQTTEFLMYNFNYTKKTTISGLPIVPSFGIKGSF